MARTESVAIRYRGSGLTLWAHGCCCCLLCWSCFVSSSFVVLSALSVGLVSGSFCWFCLFCWYSICWLVLGRCELEAGPVCVAAPWAAPNCWVSPMIFMVGARQKRPGCLSKLGVVSMLVSPRGGGVVLAAERLTPSSRAALMRAVQGSDAHTVA